MSRNHFFILKRKTTKLLIHLMVVSFSVCSFAQSEPRVCEEIEKAATEKPFAELKSDLQRKYPDCADWLSTACLSPFRLDQNNRMTTFLKQQTQANGQFCFDCLDSKSALGQKQMQQMKDILAATLNPRHPFNPTDYQAELARTALAHWELVQEKRNQDLRKILSVYQDENLSPSISNDDLKSTVEILKNRIYSATARLKGNQIFFFQQFVADQIVDASEDTVDGNDRTPGFKSWLAKEGSDEDRFRHLVSRAQKSDPNYVEQDEPGNITAYHSKMILLYQLETALKKKYPNNPEKIQKVLNQLATNLQLKADYSNNSKNSEWAWIIPHDGFVLGASAAQISNLVSSGSASQNAGGTGIDCATFVQQLLHKQGYEQLKKIGRLTTSGIASRGQLSAIADFEKFTGELSSQLLPGDLLVKKTDGDSVGHVEIVVGYEGDPPRLVTISAMGGYYRSLTKSLHPIFEKQPLSCSEDSYFVGREPSHYYRVRLKKPPK